MQNALLDFIPPLNAIHDGIVSMGRLYSLRALSIGKIDEKLIYSKEAYKNIRLAKYIKDAINEAYAIKTVNCINWRSGVSPDKKCLINKNEQINQIELDNILSELSGSIYVGIDYFINEVEDNIALYSLRALLEHLGKHFNPGLIHTRSLGDLLGEETKTNTGPVKHCQGPMHVDIDPIFTPMDSLLYQPAAVYGDSIYEAVPYYWGLSSRECLASDMCSLSIVEYDGLPIEFYVDMAKQAYDEIRHAKIFLEKAIEFIPVFKTHLNKCDKFYHDICAYEESGVGLPVPAERHLYEAMWNASLEERFVLMHHDTEMGGIKRLREKSNSLVGQQYPAILYHIDVVMHEEITHARLGNYWLNYMLPDMADRNKAFERARLLRSLFLLTSSSHCLQVPLASLINQINHSSH